MLALLGYEDKPFVEFLKSKKLTESVRHYVQHAIAMVTDDASTIEVLLLAVYPLVCFISYDVLTYALLLPVARRPQPLHFTLSISVLCCHLHLPPPLYLEPAVDTSFFSSVFHVFFGLSLSL